MQEHVENPSEDSSWDEDVTRDQPRISEPAQGLDQLKGWRYDRDGKDLCSRVELLGCNVGE